MFNRRCLPMLLILLLLTLCLGACKKVVDRVGMEMFVFPSVSMLPTIEPGDRLVVFKGPPGKMAEHGALVTFPSPSDEGITYLKRIVAVGPDVPPLKLAESQVYVLGDNRDNSMDSRHWGPISIKTIVKRASAIYMKKTGKIIRLMPEKPAI